MRRIIAIYATVLVVATAGAQTGVPAQRLPGFRAIQQSDLRRDLTYISSDELAGRMSLQPGDELATRWIANQFAKAGLEPPVKEEGGKAGYLQPFTLIEYHPDGDASFITLMRGGKGTIWHAPEVIGSYKHAVDLTRALFLRASVSPPPSWATMTTPPSMPTAKSCLFSIMSRKRMIPDRFSTGPATRATPPRA